MQICLLRTSFLQLLSLIFKYNPNAVNMLLTYYFESYLNNIG